ncbi:MAG TPA: mucoidy inhibitor MuiA family protein [Myxococcaceae bacterium]
MLLLGLLSVGALTTAVDAPITSVTVYSDRARVVRTAQLTVSGTQRIELPALRGTVDSASIRVEAEGAEVTRVDLRTLSAEALTTTEARKVLDTLDKLDDQLSRTRAEREAASAQLSALQSLRPTPNTETEPNKALPPRLDPSGWNTATAFLVDNTTRLQARLRELDQRTEQLQREQARQIQEARALGTAPRQAGLEVAPTLSGNGPVKLTLTYVTTNARWYPRYELQLVPDANRVNVSFFGLVSQETGEDWEDASLTLSTALPATTTSLPKLTTWKIGQRDRFIPTPAPLTVAYRPPPAVPPPLPEELNESEQLRQRLLARAQLAGSQPVGGVISPSFQEESRKQDQTRREAPLERAYPNSLSSTMAPAAAPQAPPPPMEEEYEGGEAYLEEMVVTGSRDDSDYDRRPRVPTVTLNVGLAPPAAYRRPAVDPRLPASLAGGYDLAFTSGRRESIPSGAAGGRRVPLFTESWPVKAERKLFPALARDAFLVAELQSPSKQVLPGGDASLFVGDDPAGTAFLKVVAPGERFTLPLGVDRAVRPVRNVKLVQSEKGFIGKDEETAYRVTIEVANPYAFPLPVRIHDQWPLTSDDDVEIKLVRTEPFARQDKVKGTLEWELTVPASGKTVVSFEYTLRHPKGWLMRQNQ